LTSSSGSLLALFCHEFSTFHWYHFTGGLPWQLRHSIVHTGGTITLPDAQKIKLLSSFGGHTITFQDQFIISLCRKISEIVKNSTKRIEKAFKDSLATSKLSKGHQERIEKLFLVE